MFNLKNFKLVNKLKNVDIKASWLRFSDAKKNSDKRDRLIEEIIADNAFVEEDLKLRNMVEEMLVEEFSADIKKQQSYNFLVDSVVNRLKQQQLGDLDMPDEDIV